jgi:hypothetical protein
MRWRGGLGSSWASPPFALSEPWRLTIINFLEVSQYDTVALTPNSTGARELKEALVAVCCWIGWEPLSPSEWRDEQATTLSDVDYEPKTKCNG